MVVGSHKVAFSEIDGRTRWFKVFQEMRKTSSGGRVFAFAEAQKTRCFAIIKNDFFTYKTIA
jgi:hypothetical protein